MVKHTKISFILLQSLAMSFGALCGSLSFAQIHANPFAPKNTQATIHVAPNGVPIINIQAPSRAGVSHNKYNQFDVPQQGVVLNNSRKGAMSHQAGAIQGNPWLAGGEARIILNEVNSMNPSVLQGFIEVGGRRAEVIVANPAGITCDGCGFINADKGTLTTGQVNVFNGVIQGYDVTQGKITIQGRGFDGTDTNYALFLAKAIEVNGPMYGNDLTLVAGENVVLPEGHIFTKNATGTGYGIDVKHLGGMYAGKISLTATDKGVGVRNAGELGASFNEIRITADGKLVNEGILRGATGVHLGVSDIENKGEISSQTNLVLTTGAFTNEGTIAANEVALNIKGVLTNKGSIGANHALALNVGAGLTNSGTIGAGQSLGLTVGGGINNSGAIISEGGALMLNAQSLTNHATGRIGAAEGLVLGITGIVTNAGTLVSQGGAGLNLQLTELTNTGVIGAKTQFNLHANRVVNSGMLLHEGATLNLNIRDLVNTATATIGGQGAVSFSGQNLVNAGSIISERGALSFNAAHLVNSGTLGSKSGLSANITGLFDNQGTVVAEGTSTLRINAGGINNSGHIESAGTVVLNALGELVNQGVVYTNTVLSLNAQSLINQGTLGALNGAFVVAQSLVQADTGSLASGGDITLNIAGNLTNSGTLSSHGTLELSAQNIHNYALIEANQLNLNSLNVNNQASGKINANHAEFTLAGSLNNFGEMSIGDLTAAMQSFYNNGLITIGDAIFTIRGNAVNDEAGLLLTDTLVLNALNLDNKGIIDGTDVLLNIGQTLTNHPKAMIFGDDLRIHAQTIDNLGIDVAGIAGSDGAIIAAREYLGLAANTINNTHHSLILSMGDMDVGGRLNANHEVEGQAQLLHNLGGRIESFGDMTLNVNTINNESRYIDVEQEFDILAEQVEYAYNVNSGLNTLIRYQEGDPGFIQVDWGNNPRQLVILYTDQYPISLHKDDLTGANFDQIITSGFVIRETLKENDAGEIIAGGNLVIEGDEVINDKSVILAGGDLYIDSALENKDFLGKEIIFANETINSYTSTNKNSQDVSTSTNQNMIERDVLIAATEVGSHSLVNPSDIGSQLSGLMGLRNRFGGLLEFNGSLTGLNGSVGSVGGVGSGQTYYQVNARFARGRTFSSLTYLLSDLGYNDGLLKRLGDGFYEQRLVQEQIFKLTGSRYLDGYSSDDDQFKALMNNALAVSEALELVPGVELTKEQVESLTESIVWVVEREVTLDNGDTVKALVPVVYAKPGSVTVQTKGALVSGNRVIIDTDKAFINEGSILGKTDLVISGFDVINKGLMAGGDVRLFADNDIRFTGGTLLAENSAHMVAGRDISVETTLSSNLNGTHVNQVANIIVTGKEHAGTGGFYEGSLIMEAGRDVGITAGMISNYSDGGITQISAERDINIGTVVTTESKTHQFDYGYRSDTRVDALGADIFAQGDLNLSAGRDISAKAASIISNAGDLALTAGRDITLESADSYATTSGAGSFKMRDKGSKAIKAYHGMLASTLDLGSIAVQSYNKATGSNTSVSGSDYASSSEGTLLSGNNVVMSSGRDLTIRGSTVAATKDIIGVAKNNITIEGTEEYSGSSHDRTTVRRGLMGSGKGSIGFSVGERLTNKNTIESGRTNVGSLIASTEGDVLFSAGNNYVQKGSDVHAYEGDVFIKGREVSIIAAEDQSDFYERNYQRQKGGTFQIGHPAISAYSTIKRLNDNRKDVTEHKGRINAIAAGTAVLALKNNYDSYMGALGGPTASSFKESVLSGAPTVNNGGGFNIGISGGTQRQQSVATNTQTDHRGSSISAGRNVSIESTHGDINIQGSLIKAGNNALLKAARDLNVTPGVRTSKTDSSRQSSGGSIGISLGYNSGIKLGVTGTANAGRGTSDYDHINYNQSYITAGNQLSIVTGRDANIIGGVLSGDKVYADIGRNLTIVSVQDKEKDRSKDYSAGGSISWAGGFSGSAYGEYQTIKGDYLSVQEQSGLFAGNQGFDITVKGQTTLVGGAIASNQQAINDKVNRLTTGTLVMVDLDNHAKYEGKTHGVMGSGSIGKNDKQVWESNGGMGVPPMVSASKDKQSTTQSGISHGTTIILTDPTKQALITGQSAEQYLATINRNVTTNIDTSGALERVYDEASIKASMNIAKEFREEAGVFSNNRNRETDAAKKLQEGLNEKGRDHWTAEDHKAFDQASKVIENNKFWTNGGTGKQILTGLSLAATGNATGSTGAFIRDAAVNVIQGMAAGKIKDIADQLDSETARALLHSIAGCAGAAAKQGDCASGAMGAGAAVVLNNLLDQLQGIDKSNLTEAEKENRVNIITGLIAGITDAVGGEGAMAGAAAQIEMENNTLLSRDLQGCRGNTALCQTAQVLTDKILGKGLPSIEDIRTQLANCGNDGSCIKDVEQQYRDASTMTVQTIEQMALDGELTRQEVSLINNEIARYLALNSHDANDSLSLSEEMAWNERPLSGFLSGSYRVEELVNQGYTRSEAEKSVQVATIIGLGIEGLVGTTLKGGGKGNNGTGEVSPINSGKAITTKRPLTATENWNSYVNKEKLIQGATQNNTPHIVVKSGKAPLTGAPNSIYEVARVDGSKSITYYDTNGKMFSREDYGQQSAHKQIALGPDGRAYPHEHKNEYNAKGQFIGKYYREINHQGRPVGEWIKDKK